MRFNGVKTFALVLILIMCMSGIVWAQMGVRYLTPDEFPKYDQMLKNYGRGDLKTTVAALTTINNHERVGLKCVNKKGTQYTVFITDGKIVNIKKVKSLSETEKKKFIEDAAREITNKGMTPPNIAK